MSITQNNRVYEDLVKYFRLKVLLNLRFYINIQNILNNLLNIFSVLLQTIGSQLVTKLISVVLYTIVVLIKFNRIS